MEIKSFPNNQNEEIGAENVMKWLHGRTSGVFGANNNAVVTAAQGAMAVEVSDGIGWLSNADGDGITWWIDSEKTTNAKLRLNLDIADGVLDRIDRVVVSWETTNYVSLPTVSILKGTPSSAPVPPALTNNSTLRQISLAQISVPAGTVSLTGSLITDERLDNTVCGIVTETTTVDTTGLYAQFIDWFAHVKGILGEDEAGALLQMIESLTPADVGLGNVPNVATNDQTPTYTEAAELTPLTSGELLSVAFGKLKKAVSSLISHIGNKNNPHGVTKAQVGLGNVDNTADSEKSVNYASSAGYAESAGMAPASDVSDWAKAASKPSYTASEVGAIPNNASCNKNWHWSGQGGQPNWLWGGNDGTNMYVYNPANFSVNYANTAGAVSGMIDLVVAQGISGIWGYRKWNSGFAECWGKVELYSPINLGWGTVYESKVSASTAYPFSFVEKPIEVASLICPTSSGLMMETIGNWSNTATNTYCAVRPDNSVSGDLTIYVYLHVIGRWK